LSLQQGSVELYHRASTYVSPQASAKGLFQPELCISLVRKHLKTFSSLHGFNNLFM